MQDDDLTVDLTRTEWVDTDRTPRQPCIRIHFDGTVESLQDAFRRPDGVAYTPDELDVFYRQQASPHAAATAGVVSVADRVTGDYVLEVPVAGQTVDQFVYAVRSYTDAAGNDDQYAVELCADETTVADFEKQTFLVYDKDGVLLRERSLIPSHVEI